MSGVPSVTGHAAERDSTLFFSKTQIGTEMLGKF